MTILQHYQAVEDETLRAKLLTNLSPENVGYEAANLADAVMRGFVWNNSAEGADYWLSIYYGLISAE